ncbi:hypothetical protein ACEPAG_2355 [Sanghuangporus baumii]
MICPAIRDGKICRRANCSLIHVVYRCRICRAPFATEEACMNHQRSRAAAHGNVYRCHICSINCLSETNYKSHIQGQKHEKRLAASRPQTISSPAHLEVPVNHLPCTMCEICNRFLAEANWDSHIRGQRHISNQSRESLVSAVRATEGDQHGLCIDGNAVDFGTIDSTKTPFPVSKQIQITNRGSRDVVLKLVKLSKTSRSKIFRVVHPNRLRQISDNSAIPIKINVIASKNDRGAFQNRLEFHFEIPALNRGFAMTRSVVARIGSNADYEALKVTKPYVVRKRTWGNKATRYIRGIRPQALAEIKWARQLKQYVTPIDVLSRDDLKPFEKLNMIRSTLMFGEFGSNTYGRHLQVMLWVEEERASQELSGYDMEEVRLSPRGKLFEAVRLEVPGLAEKRPSVIIGDRFFVKKSGSPDSPSYEGFVHHVENRFVLLQFHKKFSDKWTIGQTYDVQFDLNRLVFRRMHQAVTRPSEGGRASFPSLSQELQPVPVAFVNELRPYDNKIGDNEPQLRAVASILRMSSGSIPFIIFGPPGTGKTVTMVEAIRQIIARKPNARILACAPSNSAADIIVERLAEYRSVFGDMKKSVFRLIAPSRSSKMVSQTVLEFTRTNTYDIFESPPRDKLEAFRVIVSTCCSGGVPYGLGFEPGHFTHIFIDEAAQATEPEIMIPIKTMLGPETNVILSGDVKQLGPIIRSPIARELGLGVSYLERLMSTPVYDENRAKGRSIVKLTKNYRSHQAILNFPNAQFYKNELEACARPQITHCITGRWSGLVKSDYPVVFHGVCGQDMREDPSPSYFNPDEVIVVKDYVKSLLGGNLEIESKDIGVITPYRAQVLKLRQLLRPFAPEATIGSVEEFQGQERKIIIISTVRSSPDKITFDLRHTLGFVASPRRFNVAVTRAQALLVVVGDPFVLGLDPLWREFINHVDLRGGYTGVDLDWDTSEPVDHSARLDEARRTEGLAELEELIRRTSELDLGDDDVIEDAGAFREDD